MRGTTSLFTYAAVMAATASCATQRTDIVAETDAVRARSAAVVAAEIAQDAEAAVAFWAENAIVQPTGAPQIQGREGILDLYRQFYAGQLKDFSGTTSHITVSQSGDLAYEYGINRMVFAGPEGDLLDLGKYLLVWQKIDGEWFIVALSFTSDTPEPEPLSEGA